MLPFWHGFLPKVWWNAPESETRFTTVVNSWREGSYNGHDVSLPFHVMIIPGSTFVLECVDLVRENMCFRNFCRGMDSVSGQIVLTYKAAYVQNEFTGISFVDFW